MQRDTIVKTVIKCTVPKIPEGIPIRLENNISVTRNIKNPISKTKFPGSLKIEKHKRRRHFRFAKRFFPKTLQKVKGYPFVMNQIFFREKVEPCRKNCRSFSRLLIKLSTVPYDQNNKKITLDTRETIFPNKKLQKSQL